MRTRLVVAASITAVSLLGLLASCSFTTSFDGISGATRPVDAFVPVDTNVATPEVGTPETIAETPPPDVGSEVGDGGVSAQPPVRPPGPAVPGGGASRTLWVGVKHFHFAHSNDALKVPGAWQDWGYDIDRLCTGDIDSKQPGTCIRAAAAAAETVKDGKDCRDNNFGSQIITQLNSYNDKFENDTNTGLAEGTSAWLLALDDLGDTVDDPYVPGRLYLASQSPTRPAWDGTDSRELLPSSVVGGDIDKAVVTFPKGYLKNNVWVSGEPLDFEISIPLGRSGALMPMKVAQAVIAMRVSDAHSSIVDGTGVFAGAIAPATTQAFLDPFMITQTTHCPGTAEYAIFMKKITAYVDVVIGAPNLQDPKKSCDGISFGIGINLAPVARPLKLGPPLSPPVCGATDAAVDTGASD